MASDQKADLRGWEPLKGPRVGREAFQVTPFMRLTRTHLAMQGANALVMMALAGSVFFVDPEESRTRVLLALVMTMVPFVLLSPMIGPLLDRLKGGRRFIIIGGSALRVVLCVMMIRELESLMFYPLAFLVLMLDKSYGLAKSAIVPSTVVSDEELVKANSMLTRLSGIAGAAVLPLAGIAYFIGDNVGAFTGGQAVLALAAVGFVVATAMAMQLPKAKVVTARASQDERSELRSGGILLAASTMALVRGIIGFTFMLMAFEFQEDTLILGPVMAAFSVGSFLGTFVATGMRQAGVAEERILQLVVGFVAGLAMVAVYVDGPVGAGLFMLTVGVAGSSAKLSFDSIVQKDAPESNRGRAFAKFETRFQVVWVIGALWPVAVKIHMQIGIVITAGVAVFALVSYLTGLKAVAAGKPPPQRTKELQRKLVKGAATRTRRAATARVGRRKKTAVADAGAGELPEGADSPGDNDVTTVDPTIDGNAPTRVQERPDPPSSAHSPDDDLPSLPSPDDLVETATAHPPPPAAAPTAPLDDRDVAADDRAGGDDQEPDAPGTRDTREERPPPPETARPSSSADTTVVIDPTKLQ